MSQNQRGECGGAKSNVTGYYGESGPGRGSSYGDSCGCRRKDCRDCGRKDRCKSKCGDQCRNKCKDDWWWVDSCEPICPPCPQCPSVCPNPCPTPVPLNNNGTLQASQLVGDEALRIVPQIPGVFGTQAIFNNSSLSGSLTLINGNKSLRIGKTGTYKITLNVSVQRFAGATTVFSAFMTITRGAPPVETVQALSVGTSTIPSGLGTEVGQLNWTFIVNLISGDILNFYATTPDVIGDILALLRSTGVGNLLEPWFIVNIEQLA